MVLRNPAESPVFFFAFFCESFEPLPFAVTEKGSYKQLGRIQPFGRVLSFKGLLVNVNLSVFWRKKKYVLISHLSRQDRPVSSVCAPISFHAMAWFLRVASVQLNSPAGIILPEPAEGAVISFWPTPCASHAAPNFN